MDSAREYAGYYLQRLREGREEEAFFGLIDSDPAVVPVLLKAFAQEANPSTRAAIVRCVWQHRRPGDIRFLIELLYDPEPAVWKEALDGIVAIGAALLIVLVFALLLAFRF